MISYSLDKLKRRINGAYSYIALIEHFTGYRLVKDACLCPFHDDTKQSAKIYHDPDGDRLNCFVEGKQFTIVDYLILQGEKLEDWDPGGEEVPQVRRVWDFTPLDPFRKGEYGVEEFFFRAAKLESKEEQYV